MNINIPQTCLRKNKNKNKIKIHQTCLRKINIHINNPQTCGLLILHWFASNRVWRTYIFLYHNQTGVRIVDPVFIYLNQVWDGYEEHIYFFYHHYMGVKQVWGWLILYLFASNRSEMGVRIIYFSFQSNRCEDSQINGKKYSSNMSEENKYNINMFEEN